MVHRLVKRKATTIKVQVTPDEEKMAKRTRKFPHSSHFGVCPYDSNFDGDLQWQYVKTHNSAIRYT